MSRMRQAAPTPLATCPFFKKSAAEPNASTRKSTDCSRLVSACRTDASSSTTKTSDSASPCPFVIPQTHCYSEGVQVADSGTVELIGVPGVRVFPWRERDCRFFFVCAHYWLLLLESYSKHPPQASLGRPRPLCPSFASNRVFVWGSDLSATFNTPRLWTYARRAERPSGKIGCLLPLGRAYIRATGADYSVIEHLSVAWATTFLRNERAYDARVTPA
jgi:hypothetical protein